MTHQILIVDDTEINLILFGALIKKMDDCEAHVYSDSRQALAWAKQNVPDLVIVDYMMPDLDGIEFIGELAQRNYQGGLILVTGVNRGMLEVATDIATLKGLRLLGTFIKPVLAQDLREVLGLTPA